MATTWTTSLRFTQPAVNDPSTQNLWGGFLNTDAQLIDSSIAGTAVATITSSTYTLSANNGAADQSRPYALFLQGSAGGTCTVSIQPVTKFGLVVNQSNSTCILTTGSGSTLTLPGGASVFTPYWCDGTNVKTWFPIPPSRGEVIYTSQNTFGSSNTATWTVPTNVTWATFDIEAAGNQGGAGSSTQPGGGGGGGGYIYLGVPTIPGEAFTVAFAFGAVSVSSGSGDIYVLASPGYQGAAGAVGGAGGAGGGGTLTTVNRANLGYYAIGGLAGQAGVALSATVQAGGSGGTSGSGECGAPAFIASNGNTATAQGATYSAGGAGGCGTGAGGPASQSRVIIRY